MFKTTFIFITALFFSFFAFAQEKEPIAELPKNAITFNLGGSGFVYSLGYERQTRQMGVFRLYAKVAGYCVPFEPLLFRYKQMGGSAELGFKLGRVHHKFNFGLGVATSYYYASNFKLSFPVADGSFKYKTMFAYICNLTYQYYFKNSKWRFESGGTIIVPHKERYDDCGYTCGNNTQFERNLPIPWLTMGVAYTF